MFDSYSDDKASEMEPDSDICWCCKRIYCICDELYEIARDEEMRREEEQDEENTNNDL